MIDTSAFRVLCRHACAARLAKKVKHPQKVSILSVGSMGVWQSGIWVYKCVT